LQYLKSQQVTNVPPKKRRSQEVTHGMTFSHAISYIDTERLRKASMQLLSEMNIDQKRIRLLGLPLTNFTDEINMQEIELTLNF
jgi:hypothetical protein